MSTATDCETIAAAVEAACDVSHALPYRPSRLDSKMAFVAPADVWKQLEEDRYCGWSIGVDVWLVAASSDPREAFQWLDEQSSLVLELDPLTLTDDRAQATIVDAPVVFATSDGASFLAVRVGYSRFTTGD